MNFRSVIEITGPVTGGLAATSTSKALQAKIFGNEMSNYDSIHS